MAPRIPAFMDWIPLATRLGLHIALGYLFSLLVLGPAPVGRFFYRLTGWTAAVAAGLAGLLALSAGWPDDSWDRLRVAATLGTVLPAPLYVSNKPRVRRAGLLLAVACGATAVAAHAFGPQGLGWLQILGGLTASAVAGGVCFAMVFGHGYLTVPGLPREHLGRINRFVIAALCARLLLAGGSFLVAYPRLVAPGAEPRFGAFDWLDVGIRFGVGLLAPLLFAFMVRSSLRWKNTQSATGILYAATILVWIGEAVALNLERKFRLVL